MTKFTDRNGTSSSYTYDANGQVTSVTDSLGNITTYGYTDGLGNVQNYTVDGNGNMISKADADGYVTEYTYNSLDLVSRISYNGAKEVTYQYNKVGELV